MVYLSLSYVSHLSIYSNLVFLFTRMENAIISQNIYGNLFTENGELKTGP